MLVALKSEDVVNIFKKIDVKIRNQTRILLHINFDGILVNMYNKFFDFQKI